MIDHWDIKRLTWLLQLAKTEGTDVIQIVSGDEPSTWIVKVNEEKLLERGT